MKRLYNAICSLIEAKAQRIANPPPEPEQQMQGPYSDAQVSGKYEPDELHADQYRLARVGFTGGRRG